MNLRHTACLLFGLVGCSRGPIAPTASTVSVTLDGAWTVKPWHGDPPGPESPYPVRVATRFNVPDALAGQDVELVLEGLWWAAEVSLDDQKVATVVGGRPPARLSLPGGLSAGAHKLTLLLRSPQGVSKFAHGGGLGAGASTVRPSLHRPPVLEFHPGPTIEQGGVRMGASGAQAFVQLDPTTVPEGATVHLVTALDGRVQTDFGTHPIGSDGTARSASTPIDQPLWSRDAPALTHLMAEVRDATGTPVATWSSRTGLRAVTLGADGLTINDGSGPTVAVRVVHGFDEPDLIPAFTEGAKAGANAVELHGAMVDSQLMDQADELGIPLVVLPRCVGRVGRPPGAGAALTATLREQDHRMVRGVGAHPSVISWLVEGDRQVLGPGRKEDGELDPWTDVITSDPMDRPVLGVDVPGTVLQITELQQSSIKCPNGCSGKWLVESTFRMIPIPNLWARVARGWQNALQSGSPGGTLPASLPEERADWMAAFQPVLAQAGVEPYDLDRSRRASSRVTVSGATPGDLVWATAPGMSPKGAQVDDAGNAVVDVYYEGDATISGPGWSRTASLSAMSWEGTRLFGHVSEVKP